MLIEPKTWVQHRPWVIGTAVTAILSVAWYFTWSHNQSDWPGGSSLPGFTFGVVGGLIILFEMALWWRKKVRTWRIGRVQTWLRAHIWLGLLSVPLLILHSGFRLGGELAAVLMILFLVVIASGIWGLVIQQIVPSKMLQEIPAETIYSQIDHVTNHLIMEADRLVEATCGRDPNRKGLETSSLPKEIAGTHLVLGSVRSSGLLQGKVLQTHVPSAPIPDTEILREFYYSQLQPYLSQARADSPLGSSKKSANLFQNLRTQLDPLAHESVKALEEICDQRRQFVHQARLHFWLHSWLWVHLPLSVALVVLMIVHAVMACKFW